MEDLFQIGIITGTHGLKGEVKVFPTTDDKERFLDLDTVLIDTGKELIEKKVQYCKFFKQFVFVKFEGLDDINDVEKYKRCPLKVTRENAVPLEEDEYYVADLLGLTIVDESGVTIGELVDVIETGANDVYEVKTSDGGHVLLPAIKDCILDEDTDELVANPIVNTSPVSDVYEFAMRDLEFAAKYLPEVSSAAGRVNKYSAFGMLSRVYLTYAGYSSNPNSATRNQDYLDLAKKAALKVIENRNFELMTDYADLFMIDKNNNSETLFALQWVSNGTYGECNTIQDYFACESAITGNDRAWGGYVFAQPDVICAFNCRALIGLGLISA